MFGESEASGGRRRALERDRLAAAILHGRARSAMGDAPSAPKPGAVVRPTRRRVPGTGGFPDRLEASSCRAAAGTVSRATVSDSTPTAGGEDGGQVRRPEKSPPGLDRRRAAGSRPGTPARPFPGRARLTGQAGQAGHAGAVTRRLRRPPCCDDGRRAVCPRESRRSPGGRRRVPALRERERDR